VRFGANRAPSAARQHLPGAPDPEGAQRARQVPATSSGGPRPAGCAALLRAPLLRPPACCRARGLACEPGSLRNRPLAQPAPGPTDPWPNQPTRRPARPLAAPSPHLLPKPPFQAAVLADKAKLMDPAKLKARAERFGATKPLVGLSDAEKKKVGGGPGGAAPCHCFGRGTREACPRQLPCRSGRHASARPLHGLALLAKTTATPLSSLARTGPRCALPGCQVRPRPPGAIHRRRARRP
jgi:hypothetical protein